VKHGAGEPVGHGVDATTPPACAKTETLAKRRSFASTAGALARAVTRAAIARTGFERRRRTGGSFTTSAKARVFIESFAVALAACGSGFGPFADDSPKLAGYRAVAFARGFAQTDDQIVRELGRNNSVGRRRDRHRFDLAEKQKSAPGVVATITSWLFVARRG